MPYVPPYRKPRVLLRTGAGLVRDACARCGRPRWAYEHVAGHSRERGSAAAKKAARRASEVFLERELFKRRRDGRVIRPEFVQLHYPLYWHYDFLGGLKAMARIGRIRDPRCREALDLLESKRLPDGGWPAEAKYYKSVSRTFKAGAENVDWGGTSKKRMNEWVTVDALAVLVAAGRICV